MDCQIKILDERLRRDLPHYASHGAAGLDLRAAINEPCNVDAGQVVLIPTGIAIYLDNPSYAGLILPRSGLGHRNGIVLGNLVGLLDADYQGEIKISCWNRATKTYLLKPMERLAQLVIIPVEHVNFREVKNFTTTTIRYTGGFGHTGEI